MSVELDEVRRFIAAHEPFSRLPDEALEEIPRRMTMRYIPRGQQIYAAGDRNDYLYLIRSGAVDVIDSDGLLLDRREAGRTFGYSTLVGEPESRYAMTTVEDSLLLLLPREDFLEITAAHPDIERFYSSQSRRIAHAARQLHANENTENTDLLAVPVRSVADGRVPVMVDATATIRQAAQEMAEHNVSSVLITRNGRLEGIVTDKDLRIRVVAAGADISASITEIMTTGLTTLDPDHLAIDALLFMSESGIHHLPIVDKDGDTVIGIVTSGDIARLLRANPVYITADIARLPREELTGVFRKSAETITRSLSQGGTATGEISRVITSVADTLVRRLAALAHEELGPAPVDYCFVAVGSQGRREMGPASDQDNALILADTYRPAEHGDYFQALTTFICQGLHDAGQVLCPGDMMAMNPDWRMTKTQWLDTFRKWVGAPEPDALLHTQVYFDMRGLAGDTTMAEDVHAYAVELARGSNRTLAHLAALASRREPPLGFFRGFVVERSGEYADAMDVKKGGTAGIVQLARYYSLKDGTTVVGTRERIEASAGRALSTEAARNLVDAFDYLSNLGLNHQAEQLRAGQEPNYYINPAQLSTMNRENLRDAFGIIKKQQSLLASAPGVRNV